MFKNRKRILHTIGYKCFSIPFLLRTGIGLLLPVLFFSCTSTKNTGMTRWYHSFNTRYNVYFNGNEAYNAALKTQQDGYQENYSDRILMYPVSSLPKDKENEGGPFDKSVEKATKAIKTHSIKTKPEKKRGKRNDPKYQEFMQREEYNPFLHNAWLMLGKSQFHNGDFLVAASTFSYTARHFATRPAIVAEARIWQARCYSEMGWYYEAEDILSKLNNDNLPKNQSDWFSAVYADYLIKTEHYDLAIPYLNTAIKTEKNKKQKLRMKYLMGQLYAALGQNDLAYKTFKDVGGSTAPYPLKFSARIRQTEVFPGGNTKKITDMLNKMAKSSKNKDYLDQVYYALGNVYLSIPDTVKAVEQYKLGVEKSVQNGFDKALCQIQLGDIYFQQRKYVEAQPCYSEALGQIKKEYKDYPKVAKRSEVLDELVVYAEAVQLQDSLQVLAAMPEEERLLIVNKIVEDYIKKEEEERRRTEREEYLAEQESKRDELSDFRVGNQNQQLPGSAMTQLASNEFYFYNEQIVTQGKTEFQRKWGRRKLEDNWRRRDKTNQFDDALVDMESESDETDPLEQQGDLITDDTDPNEKAADLEAANDPRNPAYYLQNIPLTEEDMQASNEIWMDGLYNMGLIYKDKLEDYSLSIESFEDLNTRFPDNEFKLQSYYQMYLMYLRMQDTAMAEFYKNKIRVEFPESDLAVAMADPNYEYNMRMMDSIQDSLYQQTYEYYIHGNVSGIRQNHRIMEERFSQSKLMPKFMFLNALSYVQTNDADMFREKLRELLDKYPDADVSILAGDIYKSLLRGLTLSGDGNLVRGSLFNMRFGMVGEDGELITLETDFSAERNTTHMLLLVYPESALNGNLLLFTVAEFNFSNFMVNDFDLQLETFDKTGMLQIRGFNNLNEVMQYYGMVYKPETGYMNYLDASVVVVPISVDNYDLLIRGYTLEDYITFFEENYGTEYPQLIAKWDAIYESDMEEISGDIRETVEEEELSDEEGEEESLPGEEEPGSMNADKLEDEHSEDNIEEDSPGRFPENMESEIDSSTVYKRGIDEDEVLENAGKIAGDVSKSLDTANDVLDDIANDPVRGIQNLFSRRKKTNAIDEYVKQQEKEEKELRKQRQQELKEKEKAAQELAKQQEKERKELVKQQKEEEKALLKEKAEREKALAREKELERKEKEDARKQLQKEKEDARKQKQKEAKERQKQKDQERKEREKARQEEQKRKQKEREEARKQRELERKNKK